MMVKASGRSALIVATGLFVCFASTMPITVTSTALAAAASTSDGATSGKQARQGARQSKRTARRSGKAASKPAETKKAAEDVADGSTETTLKIPASVANAKAQLAPGGLASGDAAPDSAQAMTAKASVLLASADKPAEGQPAPDAVVSSDQLNDLDRALQQSPAKQTVAMASAAKPTQAAPVLASSNESTTWDQTSLIGKIFIAFGALLTMASAARMFMA